MLRERERERERESECVCVCVLGGRGDTMASLLENVLIKLFIK
jgi:hypothetical protein